ncbi:hypothetical protein L226DRAFT_109924 [Lentinus tigrinus ALCF2SS1-7]|uniref:F-box domain-containing protein n=1 Tax=Lentinus tigrinus ALCF2SS1-6 TaxID=1328759 RepID=A0A5C2S5M0_9APHY|nr:hypothetical protein L227DRAFT_169317 [Lentinus tigrinus ALCF2SS1-6]RPD73398.1 hypothetical protein L226DRAFT_109924 [Lentinus tigrinus ALCF2SS1-7]
MPIPDLPGEITDRIISNVWPDIRSLLNCALVCSRWLPASRHHLFAELRSPSKKSYDLLVSRVLHSESMRPCLASVRSVELIEGRIGERWDPLPPEEKIGHLFIRDFVGHLPNVRSLRFQAEDWIQCPWRFLSLLTVPVALEVGPLRLQIPVVRCAPPDAERAAGVVQPDDQRRVLAGFNSPSPRLHSEPR